MNSIGKLALFLTCLFSVEGKVGDYIIRKCCLENEYYNTVMQDCVAGGDRITFEGNVRINTLRVSVPDIRIVSGRLLECRETRECPETILIDSASSHFLMPRGVVFEPSYGVTHDSENHCFEMAGNSASNVSLVVAFCLHESKTLPKCCPKGFLFDGKTFTCTPITTKLRSATKSSKDFFRELEMPLHYFHELQCTNAFPQRVSLLGTAFIDACRNICLDPNNCYSSRKYCLDTTFTGGYEPSAYVCADKITKTCCQGKSFEEKDLPCTCGDVNV